MITDILGREIAVTTPPQRIVSLVPSLTEYLCAVGAADRLVGITDFCTEPAEVVANIPKVRGTKNPHRDQIRELGPDLILAAKEENRKQDVQWFEQANLPVFVTDICRVDDVIPQLAQVAGLVEAEEMATPLLNTIQHHLTSLQQALLDRPRKRFLAFIWRDPWMVVGGDTYAHDLLTRCGGENLALHFEGRYPRATLEDFLAYDPEVIFLPDEPYVFTEDDLAAFAPFTTVPAIHSSRVHLCDGKLLTWYGPRMPEAFAFCRRLLV
ncbi:MAG: helical backbone metal receptor [Chloroflexota bacterium]